MPTTFNFDFCQQEDGHDIDYALVEYFDDGEHVGRIRSFPITTRRECRAAISRAETLFSEGHISCRTRTEIVEKAQERLDSGQFRSTIRFVNTGTFAWASASSDWTLPNNTYRNATPPSDEDELPF